MNGFLALAIETDNVDAFRQISVENLPNFLKTCSDDHIKLWPPLALAVCCIFCHQCTFWQVACCARRCVTYLLSVPDIDVNPIVRYDHNPTICLTPFAVAISQLIVKSQSRGLLTDKDIACARLLARDTRTNMNVTVYVGDRAVDYAILIVRGLVDRRALPDNGLLVDMVRNPTVDINKRYSMELHEDYVVERLNNVRNMQTLALTLDFNGADDVIDALFDNAKLDLSTQCTHFGYNVLHWATCQSHHYAVGKLLERMTVEDVNMETKKGMKPYRMGMNDDDSEHPQLLRLFIDCSKVKLDADTLGLFIALAIKYDREENFAMPIAAEKIEPRRRACIALIDAVLRCPRFDMTAAHLSDENPFVNALEWPDESMLIRVLRCPTLDARILRADRNNLSMLFRPLLHLVINEPLRAYSLLAFKELLKFGEMRDQITGRSGGEQKSALHYAIAHGRDDLLRLLLTSTTDACASVRMLEHSTAMGRTPRQLAKLLKRRRCVQVIDKIVRMGKKNVSENEHGHVFDCC